MDRVPIKKLELLAPAGNFEKLEIAIHYGADAVYLSGKEFSLRNFSGNFTLNELKHAIALAHRHNVKVYVACNIYSRNHEQKTIRDFMASLKSLQPDAVIVSDPGIVLMATESIPEIPLHLSTQASTTNYNAIKFWQNQGVQRINVARELSIEEIKEIASKVSAEIEAFVHGAMCISYSGRCLLSSFMENRDSNRGMCCHPCRFSYAVVEAKRPGQYYPLAEDQRGSYIFNSRDLCMIEHLPEMITSGITSLKIEGRMKGINYLASVVKVYREALDAYIADPPGYRLEPRWLEELDRISNRGYGTGFYLGDADNTKPEYSGRSTSGYRFIAKVKGPVGSGRSKVEARNKIFKGDDIEVVTRSGHNLKDRIIEIRNSDDQSVDFAQPGSIVTLTLHHACMPNDLIRKVPQ